MVDNIYRIKRQTTDKRIYLKVIELEKDKYQRSRENL